MSLPDGSVDQIVDARGHRCPTPTLRLRKALERVRTGGLVVLLADDPLARIDVPHFASSAGHAVEGVSEQGSALVFRVRKG